MCGCQTSRSASAGAAVCQRGQRDQRATVAYCAAPVNRPRIESVLFAECGQGGGRLGRAVQLAGLDPDQDLHLPDIRQAERALREGQLLTTAFGGGQFGFGTGQVGVDVARQCASGCTGPRPIVRHEQHRVEFAAAASLGQRVRGDLQSWLARSRSSPRYQASIPKANSLIGMELLARVR